MDQRTDAEMRYDAGVQTLARAFQQERDIGWRLGYRAGLRAGLAGWCALFLGYVVLLVVALCWWGW